MRLCRVIKRNATTGHATSYMLSYMHPVYRAGQLDHGMYDVSQEWHMRIVTSYFHAGSDVTTRNQSRIHDHISDPSFVTSHSSRIRIDLRQLADQTVEALSEKLRTILDATDADVSTIQAPDAVLLAQYPDFGRSVSALLEEARHKLDDIANDARGAQEDARTRGYI